MPEPDTPAGRSGAGAPAGSAHDTAAQDAGAQVATIQDAGAQGATGGRLREALADGRTTAAALTAGCLARISQVNPALRAVISVNPDAAAEAEAIDRRYPPGTPRPPLAGIPVLVKDNIDVRGLPATAGSPALAAGGPAPAEAFLVTRLRAAGAVILGKANLSEWANFRSTHPTSGWSTLGGQAVNLQLP